MQVVYAYNCDLYYDRNKEKTVLVKRTQHFVIHNTIEDYHIMKDIIRRCQKQVCLEQMVNELPVDQKKTYLRYIKLFLEQKILIEARNLETGIEEELVQCIISEFEEYEQIIEDLSTRTFYVMGQSTIYNRFYQMGLHCEEIQTIETNQSNGVYIGNFTSKQCKELLDTKNVVILYEERQSTIFMMYLNQYEEDSIQRFRQYTLESNSTYSQRDEVVAINLLLLFIRDYFCEYEKNFLCIASDASIQFFNSRALTRESMKYFNRESMNSVEPLEALMELETLTQTMPWLVEAVNQENSSKNQSPICNYEVVFGTQLDGIKSVGYHENYVQAGLEAFVRGIEKAINCNQSSDEQWSCGRNLEDYYIKAYIQLLPEVEQSYGKARVDSRKIEQLLGYLNEMTQQNLQLYYAPSVIEQMGSVAIVDETGHVCYESKVTYQAQTEFERGLYTILAQLDENNHFLHMNNEIVCSDESIQVVDLKEQEAKERLKEYFREQSIIIEDEIWAYQNHLKKTGVHVGKFRVVD